MIAVIDMTVAARVRLEELSFAHVPLDRTLEILIAEGHAHGSVQFICCNGWLKDEGELVVESGGQAFLKPPHGNADKVLVLETKPLKPERHG